MKLKSFVVSMMVASSVFGASDQAIMSFVGNGIKSNPGVTLKSIKVVSRQKVIGVSSWEAVKIMYEVTVSRQGRSNDLKMQEFVFTSGELIAPDLFDAKKGVSLKTVMMPSPVASDYRSDRLIAGTPNATHKIIVFSDPLCPFCKDFMTDAIEEAKKKPQKFAVYLYHFPLTSIHPQSPVLIRAMIAAENLGFKDVAYKVYSANLEFKTTTIDEVVDVFNKTVGSKLTKEQLLNAKVEEHYKTDAKRADELMIKGTPSVFIDGKSDPKREKFEAYRKEGK